MTPSLEADPHNLQRFIDAQDAVIFHVRDELLAGRKTGHWMWYIFPQIDGLGSSATAREFAISSLTEAKAYLAHPLLATRIRECSELVNEIEGCPIDQIFHFPDNVKFQSSMTLFAHATTENSVFLAAIQKYFSGKFDESTLRRIGSDG